MENIQKENIDVYTDYPFEDVMFRKDYSSGKIFRKFYGDTDETSVSHDNNLYSQAVLHGERIAKEEYINGKDLGNFQNSL